MVDVWVLIDLFLTFAGLGLIAIGGQNTILTEVYRQVVDVHRWMSAADLADLIALTQAAPGPNGQFVALRRPLHRGHSRFGVGGIEPLSQSRSAGRVNQFIRAHRFGTKR